MQKYSAPAIVKLLDMIEYLSQCKGEQSINEIARQTNIPLNSVYRICMELEARGYLYKNHQTGAYQLGMGFYYIGKSAGSRNDFLNMAHPVMQVLCDTYDETVHLCVLKNKKLVLLDQVETNQPIKIQVKTGSVLYPHASAFGKCILANLAPAALADCLDDEPAALTPNTLKSREALKKELAEIKEKGYAIDNEEYLEGVLCVGCPVFGRGRKIIGAMGIVGPKYRLSSDHMQEYIKAVKQNADILSRKMGCI